MTRSAKQFLSPLSSSVSSAEMLPKEKVEIPQLPKPLLNPPVQQQPSRHEKRTNPAAPPVSKSQKSAVSLAVQPNVGADGAGDSVALLNKQKEPLAPPLGKETVHQTVVIATPAQEGQFSPGQKVASLLSTPQLAHGSQTSLQAIPRYDLNPLPQYPEIARRRGQQGAVQLEVLVLANGRVGETKLVVSSGYKGLDRAAQKAVRHWQFKPAKSFGVAVVSRVVVPVDFVLNND